VASAAAVSSFRTSPNGFPWCRLSMPGDALELPRRRVGDILAAEGNLQSSDMAGKRPAVGASFEELMRRRAEIDAKLEQELLRRRAEIDAQLDAIRSLQAANGKRDGRVR
jgi:hypothetical protein